jgi:hypothetical protein
MAISDAISGDPYSSGPPTPTEDPVQLEKNKSLWRNFLSNLHDPNVQSAIMSTGIGLLRSPQYGQNSGDVIANALSSGVNTLQGLRQLDYQKQQATQKRGDTLNQQNVENNQRQQQIGISQAQQGTYATSVQQQGEASQRLNEREQAALGETSRHNRASEANQATAAQADLERARAYKANTIGKTPQDIQKIDMLAQSFIQNEGMDEVSARARATMIVESTGRAKSPGDAAQALYQEKLKNWQGDISNFGKSLPPEQARQMLNDSMNEIMLLHSFGSGITGTGAPPVTNQGGPIVRPPAAQSSGETTLGQTKAFREGTYKKVKRGPDSDQSTWQKVTTPNGARK